MTKQELFKKYTVAELQECAFWEDTETFKPFNYKSSRIASNLKISENRANEMLKDYQHFMEI